MQRQRERHADKILSGTIGNEDDILARLIAANKKVTCPLILISQVQRSGGTLLSQLFDGHAQVLAHPHELGIGHPTKDDWPAPPLGSGPDAAFRMLFEDTTHWLAKGYAKTDVETVRRHFFLLPHIQSKLFASLWDGPKSQREVLDLYFTSYFNAWLNYRGRIGKARYVAGFVPRMVSKPESIERFFACYPDGFLISIIRDPWSWYASAMRHNRKDQFGTLGQAIEAWCTSTTAVLREKEKRPERVLLVKFAALLESPEGTMRHLCESLGLLYEDILTVPTFNSDAVDSNTSFDALERGKVSRIPAQRAEILTPEERDFIDARCGELYQAA